MSLPPGTNLLDLRNVRVVLEHYSSDRDSMQKVARAAHAMFEQGLIDADVARDLDAQARRNLTKIHNAKIARWTRGRSARAL